MMGNEMRNDGRRSKRKNGRGEGMRIEEGWDEGR